MVDSESGRLLCWLVRCARVAEEASRSSMVLKHSKDVGDKNKDVTTLEWNREGTLLATGAYKYGSTEVGIFYTKSNIKLKTRSRT